MDCLNGFPAKESIYKWLNAGYVDSNTFNNKIKGTPQGSVISPLLANIALFGMEKELGIRYYKDGGYHKVARNCVGLVTFADDFVVVCKTEEEAKSMYIKLKPYLKKRGLVFAEDKTRVTHITEGFDFLGFNLRQYKTNKGMKLFIKPSKDSVKKAKETIKEVFKNLRGNPIGDLIVKLNPIIRGIGNYWSAQVSKKKYIEIDRYIWLKVRKHLKLLYQNKSFKWIHKQCFKADYTGVSKDKWILTDPHNFKTQLTKMSWIPIVRHSSVKYKNSPDDASLKEYFQKRDAKEFIRDNVMSRRKLAKQSNYKCRVCKQSLVSEEVLIKNQIVPYKLGGRVSYSNLELLHKSCCKEHNELLKRYGGGKDYPKISSYFENRQIFPNSKEGYKLMKDAFKKFKYQYV